MNMLAPGLLLVLSTLLLYGIPIGGLLYLGLRWVRAVERRNGGRAELHALTERVAQLEEELGRTTGDVERLREEQRFTTRLLAERSGAPGA